MSRRTETEDMIRNELDRYQVVYAFGEGGKHPFVSIKGQDGRQRRVTYAGSPSGMSVLAARADLRRALREIGAQPWPEERKSARVGSFGAALLDAAAGEHHRENETMQTNGHANGAEKAAPPPAPKREYSKLNQAEVVQLTLLIGQHATVDFNGKTVDYADGWGDQRLTDMLRAAPGRDHLKLKTIIDFRRENFGFIAEERQTGASDGRGTVAAVAALKRQVADLETRVRSLEDAVTSPRKERF